MNTNEDNNSIDFEQIVRENFEKGGERKQRLFNHVLTTFSLPIQI